MIKAVAVLPYLDEPDAYKCAKTLDQEKLNVYIVDNTVENKGVAESWNKGIDFMRAQNAGWLVIISASMRFGEEATQHMLAQIESHPESLIINFAKKDVKTQPYAGASSPPFSSGVFYWHCIALNAKVFDAVGYFDPNFHPIYLEDTDYDLRLRKAGLDKHRVIVPIDAISLGAGRSVARAGLKPNTDELIAYFATKWGRHPSAAKLGEYDRPFDNQDNLLGFFPPAMGRVWNV